MERRQFLVSGGAAATAGLAGCSATKEATEGATAGSSETQADSLTVATYSTFVDAPSDSPGEWIKQTFEDRYDVEFEWAVPDRPITHYIVPC